MLALALLASLLLLSTVVAVARLPVGATRSARDPSSKPATQPASMAAPRSKASMLTRPSTSASKYEMTRKVSLAAGSSADSRPASSCICRFPAVQSASVRLSQLVRASRAAIDTAACGPNISEP